MCRLFGMTSGTKPVGATFWLLDAPDSLAAQSRRNVDGSGIGYFDQAGQSILDKQPEPAFSDEEFIREAKQAVSTTFVAHVRWATAGSRTVRNTHPFAMHGRIMAHNGGFGDLARLDYQLGTYRKLVLGDTDSERYFALITQQIDVCGGDVGAGITAAARWIGERLPVSSLNVIVATPGELWALRYPGQHALHVIERAAGDSIPAGPDGAASPDGSASPDGAASPDGSADPASSATPASRSGAVGQAPSPGLHVRSSTSSVHSPALRSVPTVVVASEELDGERGWRMLGDGELIHVRSDLTVESAVVIPGPPARLVPLPAGSPNIDT
jgi:predicted glutamine amidotransferase